MSGRSLGGRGVAGVMTDTDYDRESFRVRLVNLPLDCKASKCRLAQMKDSFKREIDPAQWERRMRSLRALPFNRPKSGMVAGKVIDHTGL